MGSLAEPRNQVRHKKCIREKYKNYNKVNTLGFVPQKTKYYH